MGRRRKKGKSRGGGADGEPHKSSRSGADSAMAGGDQKVLSGDEAERERGSDGEPHPRAGSRGGMEQERLDLGLRLQHVERETERQRGSRGGSDGVPHPRAGSNAGTEQQRLDLGLQLQHGEGQATASSSIGGLGVPMPGGGGGGGTGRTAAASQRVATGVVEPAGKATPSGSPSRSFLSEVVLSWTVRDILDEHLYRAEVQKIPTIINSIDQFAEVHCPLLLEELRWILSSAIQNSEHTQFCEVLSVEKCGSDSLYLDIDLDACDPDNFLCRHVAHDYDVCLLTSDPLGDSNLDPFSSSLGIVMNVGYDTFFQRGFKVKVAKHEEVKSKNWKYVSFLTNIEHRMEIYNICSVQDGKSRSAVKGVMELYEKANIQCNICDASSDSDLFSSVQCPHKEHVEIVWAPPGSIEGRIANHMEEFLSSKQKILICLPSTANIPATLTELKEFSNSVVVLNNSEGLKNYISDTEVFLASRSHKLYCFVTQFQGSMKGMSSLLSVSNFYHYSRCSTYGSCARCKKKGLLHFSMKSFEMKFNDFIGYIMDCLTLLDKQATSFSLLEEDSTKIGELLKDLKEFESLLCNENLQEKHVAAAFGLMPRVDASSLDSTYTLAEALNGKRISSMNLMSSLINSVQVPNMKNRDDLNRFCIKHSSIIVTTVDYTFKLHDMEREQFHMLIILGANQIKEADLLVPFTHSVKNVILIGDPYHIKPAVQSELCKEAGCGISIFYKMQQLVPRKVLMLEEQFALHPLINKFPNNHFYGGKIKDDMNVLFSGYKELSAKFYIYYFLDIPFSKMKSTVNSAVILSFLQSFCKDLRCSDKRFSVAVVCLSSDQVNRITDLLKFEKDIQAKVHLYVKTISSFQKECFDLVILSLVVEDKLELSGIEENNLYAVLTSSRHYFWMMGEYNTLIDTGGIWQSLVLDAKQRECVHNMPIDKLSEAVKIFEKIDKDRCTNSGLSNKFPDLLGQELTWHRRPYKSKYMLPPVRNQKGQPDTCSFHSISGAVESLFRFLYANLVPPQEFKLTFNVDDFKQKYEATIAEEFQSEVLSERGDKRFVHALEAFKNLGVMAKNESGTEVREFKISCHEHVNPKNTDEVTKLLKDGNIMVGRIRLSRNFYSLKPGDVYVHDKSMQLYHTTSDLPVTHGMMMIGIGRRRTKPDKETGKTWYSRHMVSQNSEGELCGINGVVRVGKKSVLSMHRIQVLDPQLRA